MNQSDPVVSVIMPCYNQGRYLDEAVESVLAQTYHNFEIIVINDGSTDAETIEILRDYQKPGVSILHTDNRGPASARNTGIQQARGQYILPLDADDRIAPTYLEQAVNILDGNSNVGIVYCEAEFFGEKTGKFDLPGFNFPGILLGNMIFNSSFYRKTDWEKVGGYRDNYRGWEDYDFWLSLLELGREVIRIPETLYFYRQINTSRSNSMNRQNWVEDYTRLFQNHPNLYIPNINILFEHIVDLREDIHQTHSRLAQALQQLQESEHQRLQAEAQLSAVLSSKFGRLYTWWGRFKAKLAESSRQP
ncbi:glycosyltransferase family 2 protein [Leptothermofonsia sichuanensis E412]|uniref:glycosyltransferase family 2 protein n=1 Tax=Leptothermofonsia sichuanensis TaxID=2917832 RepID=UPI001CA637CD|nr:glycosyltransferase family A protein [Leptothermofonsia sichuanensis]QZZ21447.1 glycosyltransferase family 2 protein [Leptothermofonsia sichuanensis E412]